MTYPLIPTYIDSQLMLVSDKNAYNYRKLLIDTPWCKFFLKIFIPGVVQVLTTLLRENLPRGKSELLHGLIINFIL